MYVCVCVYIYIYRERERDQLPYHGLIAQFDIAEGNIVGFIPFPRVLALCEMMGSRVHLLRR